MSTLYILWLNKGRDGTTLNVHITNYNKIFNGQGPDGYMRNVVHKEVLEM
jgi:hypothetical protein